jgi:tetrahydromethanopterin S-methyltransferase subunit G
MAVSTKKKLKKVYLSTGLQPLATKNYRVYDARVDHIIDDQLYLKNNQSWIGQISADNEHVHETWEEAAQIVQDRIKRDMGILALSLDTLHKINDEFNSKLHPLNKHLSKQYTQIVEWTQSNGANFGTSIKSWQDYANTIIVGRFRICDVKKVENQDNLVRISAVCSENALKGLLASWDHDIRDTDFTVNGKPVMATTELQSLLN